MSPFASQDYLLLGTLTMGIVSGLVPVVNIEVYLLGVAALSPAQGTGVVLLATLGQVLAKSVLYLSGRGLLKLSTGRAQAPIERATAAFARYPNRAGGFVLFSSIAGFPPIYAVSIAAGALRMHFGRFVTPMAFGRLLRFSLVFGLTRLATR